MAVRGQRSSVGTSLLRQEGVPVGLHLLEALHQMVVGHLHLLDLIQSRAQLRRNTGCAFMKSGAPIGWLCRLRPLVDAMGNTVTRTRGAHTPPQLYQTLASSFLFQ